MNRLQCGTLPVDLEGQRSRHTAQAQQDRITHVPINFSRSTHNKIKKAMEEADVKKNTHIFQPTDQLIIPVINKKAKQVKMGLYEFHERPAGGGDEV